jgi:hypothetical protein
MAWNRSGISLDPAFDESLNATTPGRNTDEGVEIIRRTRSISRVSTISSPALGLLQNQYRPICRCTSVTQRPGALLASAPAGRPAPGVATKSLTSLASCTAAAGPARSRRRVTAPAPRPASPTRPHRPRPAVRRLPGAHQLRSLALFRNSANPTALVERIATGVSKFILRPAPRGDEGVPAQTRRPIEEVLPQVARQWPKPTRRCCAA